MSKRAIRDRQAAQSSPSPAATPFDIWGSGPPDGALRPKPPNHATDEDAAPASRSGPRARSPLGVLDEPFALDLELDNDEFDAPPLRGKTHPRAEISDVVPTLDDEVRHYRHHPNDSAGVEFETSPENGDAAADLASDLGSEFLEGATRGQDMSDVIMSHEDDGDFPYLIDAELDASDIAPDDDEEPITERAPRRDAPAPKRASGIR